MIRKHRTRRSSCPINASLEILGDRWTLLVVRDLMFGGARTYKDLLSSEEGIATNVLADRLAKLQRAGMITSTRDPNDRRSSIYELTTKGVELLPVLMELSRWGTRFEEGKPPDGILDAWMADSQALLRQIRARHGQGMRSSSKGP